MTKAHPIYEIKVQGLLDPKRLSWFEYLTVRPAPDGETLLVGPIRDQSALHGLLSWLYDIGIPLISVKQLVTENEEKEK